MGIVVVRPGETVTVVGAEADPNAPRPSHPIMLPGMPGWGAPPVPPSGGGPVDPGYSPPWAQVGGPRPSHPIALPGDPWWGQDLKPTHPIVIPPTEPPPVEPPPSDSGNWVWAWSPQAGRWVWVKVPGSGEAGPKA